jgi:hypothetical protein
MNEPSAEACLKRAGRAVRLVREQLVSPTPQTLDQCGANLEQAGKDLFKLMELVQANAVSPGLRDSVRQFAREMERLNEMLDSSARFYAGWVRLAGAMTGGYSPDGAPLAWPPTRLSAQG